jgi:hypothetical protein
VIAEQADALVDIYYYSLNCASKKGVNLSSIFGIVHAANMAKRDPATGQFLRRADGKIIKPEGWQVSTRLGLSSMVEVGGGRVEGRGFEGQERQAHKQAETHIVFTQTGRDTCRIHADRQRHVSCSHKQAETRGVFTQTDRVMCRVVHFKFAGRGLRT